MTPKSKIEFLVGRHNPFTLYMREVGKPGTPYEIPIGFICDERAALLAAEMMTAGACLACPIVCESCTLNNANCECPDHVDDYPSDESRMAASDPFAPIPQPAPRESRGTYWGNDGDGDSGMIHD